MLKSLPLVGTLVATVMAAHAVAAASHAKDEEHVPCVQRDGLPMVECTLGKSIGEDGQTLLTATFPNGFERVLTFADGRFIRGNPTMSGVGTDTETTLDEDILYIRVDDQRFEIPLSYVTNE